MISQELISILACPESKQKLSLAKDETVSELNGLITLEKITTVQGVSVKGEVETLLIRDDNKVGYPVREGIPVLLIEEGIILSGLETIVS
jgi:uncharacterized protein YbaR (Trm112 family)